MSLRCVCLLASALFARTLQAVSCYHPNGDIVNDPDYAPCDRAAAANGTMCCNLNRASFPDTCASNGLCRNGGDTFRDSCTDSTWKSPMCLQQLCNTGFGQSGEDVGNPNGEKVSTSCGPLLATLDYLILTVGRFTKLTIIQSHKFRLLAKRCQTYFMQRWELLLWRSQLDML